MRESKSEQKNRQLSLEKRDKGKCLCREESSENVVGALLVGLVVGPALGAFGFWDQVFDEERS